MYDSDNQNRRGRGENYSNGPRGGGGRGWRNFRGNEGGGGTGRRGRGYSQNYNDQENDGWNENRRDYQQDQGSDNRGFWDIQQPRQEDNGFGGYNQQRNGFQNSNYGGRRQYDPQSDQWNRRDYRQDNRNGRYSQYPENGRDSPQNNDRRRGEFRHEDLNERAPPQDFRRQNFTNWDNYERNDRPSDNYQLRGRRGRGGNFNQPREQHNPFGIWVRPSEDPTSQFQEENHWFTPVYDQPGSSSFCQPERRRRDISPESVVSTSSVEMPREKTRLSSASSTLSITPLQTPSTSCPPSSAMEVLTEAAIQLSLQDQQGTSRDTEITSHLLVDAPMAPASRKDKQKVPLTTNIFPLNVQQKIVYNYGIDMKIVAENGKEYNLSKGSANKMQRGATCVAVIRAALETYKLLRDGEATLYDGAAMLYCSESLMAAMKPYSNVLEVSIVDLPEHIRRTITVPDAARIVIEIGSENQFDISDFAEEYRNRDLDNLNRTHQSFFDMLTNEPALRQGQYVAFGSGRMFPQNGKAYGRKNGQELKDGINKGIVFIEPKNNSMVPALVLDLKVGQFYVHQNVINTIGELLKWNEVPLKFPMGHKAIWNKVNQFVKGMRFTLLAGNQERTFMASGISSIPIGHLTEENFKREKIPVLQADRFGGMNLRNVRLEWPAIVVRGKVGNKIITSYYPMELLMVAKNQRVPQHKIDDKPRAARVQDRFECIHRMVEALDLDTASPHHHILRAFGVRVSPTPLKVEGIRRQMPNIQFTRRTVQPAAENASFKIMEYVEPGQADDVVVAYDCPMNIVREMQARLETAVREKKIQVARWHAINVVPFGRDPKTKVKAAFEEIAQWKKQKKVGKSVLVIYVDDEKSNSHGYLKYYERHYLILSQHLTTRVAKDLTYKTQTRDNVLHKMNCKLGGINYSIVPDEYAKLDWISNGKSLIVGYDVAHPTGMSHDDRIDKKPPNQASVVGMSFNGARNPEAFIGDYHFQLPKKEEVSDNILTERIKWMLGLFLQNRGHLPENIFLIRDGVSEGQYKMVLNKELPAFQDGVEEFRNMKEEEMPNVQQWQPKYVVVVVCKRHNKRFVIENNGKFQNALPGTVADDKVVRKDMTHFYMQPHRVIQGTGKFPSYHVLKYDLDKDVQNKTQDKLQAFLFALSFNHQIFAGSISLPEPVYQADEWAKRGKDLFKVYEEIYDFPRHKSWNKNLYVSPPIDYEELTRRLCFKGTDLQDCRVNA